VIRRRLLIFAHGSWGFLSMMLDRGPAREYIFWAGFVPVRRVACIGAGVIGAGWAVHFLSRGYEVAVWDPMKDLRIRIERFVADAWSDLARRGTATDEWASRLSFADTLDVMVHEDWRLEQIGFAQEIARGKISDDLWSALSAAP